MKKIYALTSLLTFSCSLSKSLGFLSSSFGFNKQNLRPFNAHSKSFADYENFSKNSTKPNKIFYEEPQFNEIFYQAQQPIFNQDEILAEFSDKRKALNNIIRSSLVLKMLQKNIANRQELTENAEYIGYLSPSIEMGTHFNDIYSIPKKINQSQFIQKIAEAKNLDLNKNILNGLTIASEILDSTDFDSNFFLEKNFTDKKNNQYTQFILRGRYNGNNIYFLIAPLKDKELELLDISKNLSTFTNQNNQ